ncbi:flagellar basal body protein FliL [Amycolatopsis dongchuanensis]|uniref:flagellar basal body protein FliL n=1 Tax=Amycolatopsis dongchuanensis TaxID=1070866 RepID=UPI0031F73AD9
MTWQEDLRRLDEELAAGQISADDYRVRRDRVLSSAVNSAGPEQAADDGTQIVPPFGGAAPAPPPGPPPAVEPPPAGGENVDATQAIKTNWQQPHQQQPSGSDAESTQIVPPVAPPHPQTPPPGVPQYRPQGPTSGGFPAQQPPAQPDWNAPGFDAQPPWGGSEFPPLASQGNREWTTQGAEGFDTGSPSSSRKKLIGIIAAVVVVVGLGVGAYFVFSGSDSSGGGTQAQTTAPATSPAPPDDLAIAALPGTPRPVGDIATFQDVVNRGVLTDKENQVYQQADAGKVRISAATLPSGVNALVLTVETASAQGAATARDDLVSLQSTFGMQSYTGTLPGGVAADQIAKSDNNPAAIRAHYAHGNTVVRVEVSGADLSSLNKVFDEILATQLQTLPADA